MEKRLFTSESVTEGHPDKMCDAISDAILDALMEKDPMSRVACETASCTGFVLVTGEITTNAYVDIPKIVRETVKEIGYDKSEYGFDGNTCAVMVSIDEQSSDIAMGVDKALEAKENQVVIMLRTFSSLSTRLVSLLELLAEYSIISAISLVKNNGFSAVPYTVNWCPSNSVCFRTWIEFVAI